MKFVRKIFNFLSIMAAERAVAEDYELKQVWGVSKEIMPDLSSHYASFKIDHECQVRLRQLICAQALFMKKVLVDIGNEGVPSRSWVDVGDSDGSARLHVYKAFPNLVPEKTLGINLQPRAVSLVRSKGLSAECINAMDMPSKGMFFDVVSLFETLEHMPNPIGFLEGIHGVVGQRLVLSVPLLTASRVGLHYLIPKHTHKEGASYENTHIFELSAQDWIKLFKHTGWTVDREWRIWQFPRSGPLRWIMQYAWRKISFEGYLFISLKKDNTFTKLTPPGEDF